MNRIIAGMLVVLLAVAIVGAEGFYFLNGKLAESQAYAESAEANVAALQSALNAERAQQEELKSRVDTLATEAASLREASSKLEPRAVATPATRTSLRSRVRLTEPPVGAEELEIIQVQDRNAVRALTRPRPAPQQQPVPPTRRLFQRMDRIPERKAQIEELDEARQVPQKPTIRPDDLKEIPNVVNLLPKGKIDPADPLVTTIVPFETIDLGTKLYTETLRIDAERQARQKPTLRPDDLKEDPRPDPKF